jgi:hypothetical protein
VEHEFIDHHASEEADVGAAAFEDAHRGQRARQGLRIAALDDFAHVLQDFVGTRALRQAVADLLADDFIVIRIEAGNLGVRDRDHPNRNFGLVEERDGLVTAFARVPEVGFALMAGYPGLLARRRLIGDDTEVLTEGALDTVW